MSYKIEFEKSALKFLHKQDKKQQERILKAIYKLPDYGDIKPMAGQLHVYRLRLGDIRILYSVEKNIITIFILNIGYRGDIYK